MTDKKTTQLSAIGMDARDGLKAWRLCSPTEFNRKVDAMVVEVKALRPDDAAGERLAVVV